MRLFSRYTLKMKNQTVKTLNSCYQRRIVTKMRISLALIIFGALIFNISSAAEETKRTGRIFGDWFSSGLSGLLPRCTGCPPRNCVRDSAVIHGYCCGCARVSDFLPIDCPGINVRCPPDGRRLCRDYDYMLDCCC